MPSILGIQAIVLASLEVQVNIVSQSAEALARLSAPKAFQDLESTLVLSFGSSSAGKAPLLTHFLAKQSIPQDSDILPVSRYLDLQSTQNNGFCTLRSWHFGGLGRWSPENELGGRKSPWEAETDVAEFCVSLSEGALFLGGLCQGF